MKNNTIEKVDYFIETHVEPDNMDVSDSVTITYDDFKKFFVNEGVGDAFDNHILDFLAYISNKLERRVILKEHPINHDLRELEASNIGEVVSFESVIKSISDITPEGYRITYLCKNCFRSIKVFVPQIDLEEKSSCPVYCSECQKMSSFEEVKAKTDFFNVLRIKVEEPFENREGGRPRNFNCIIKGELASPKMNLQPGDKVKITGLFKEITVKRGRTNKRMFIIDVFNIEGIETTYKDMKITEDEEKAIKKLAEDKDIFDKLKEHYLPNYIDNEELKDGLLCQAFSDWGNDEKRQAIHVLIVGDPGTGKSQNLLRIKNLNLKASYTVGGATTEAGLLGATVRDEITGEWSIEAGLLPMCNEGLLSIDELDKSHNTLLPKLNEAMEQGTCTITKAGRSVTFQSKTSIVACMNPAFEYFDYSKDTRNQIKIPPTLFDRFDLVYTIQDIPNETHDRKLVYQLAGTTPQEEPEISDEMLLKYIIYAKREIKPEMSHEATYTIQNYYQHLRKTSDTPRMFSNRDIEALIRISKAIARIELKDSVSIEHAQKAIKIFKESIETWRLKIRIHEEQPEIMEMYDSNY